MAQIFQPQTELFRIIVRVDAVMSHFGLLLAAQVGQRGASASVATRINWNFEVYDYWMNAKFGPDMNGLFMTGKFNHLLLVHQSFQCKTQSIMTAPSTRFRCGADLIFRQWKTRKQKISPRGPMIHYYASWSLINLILCKSCWNRKTTNPNQRATFRCL